MISTQHKAIGIHIPRCGGTSMETFFGNIEGHHENWQWYATVHRRLWLSSFKFAIVRDPFSRLESLWHYWNNVTKAEWFGDLDQKQNIKYNMEQRFKAEVSTFEEMLEKIPHLRECGFDRHFDEMTSFIYNRGQLMVDMILWLDTLDRDWLILLDRLGIRRAALPHKNASKGPDASPRSGLPLLTWTEANVALVHKHFPNDCRHLNLRPLEDFEYCGQCPCCEEHPDNEQAGYCFFCNNPFCWGSCGSWYNTPEDGAQHVCNNCAKDYNCEED